jgi:hypothetical protein
VLCSVQDGFEAAAWAAPRKSGLPVAFETVWLGLPPNVACDAVGNHSSAANAPAAIDEHRLTGHAPEKGRSMVPDEHIRMAYEISESMRGKGIR